jgi:hypothetical protein
MWKERLGVAKLAIEHGYFWFGKPIDTTRFAGRHEDDDAARAVRDEVKAAVEAAVVFLQAEREHDPYRSVRARLSRRATRTGTDLHRLSRPELGPSTSAELTAPAGIRPVARRR